MQSFPPSDLVSYAGFVLVTDQLPAPADFLLHRFLHVRLKEMKQSNCIFLSMSEDLGRIKAVASKAVGETFQLTIATAFNEVTGSEPRTEPKFYIH